jgi:hypothetical protein
MTIGTEILINAYLVLGPDNNRSNCQFEFILNNNFELLRSIKIQPSFANKNFIVTENANYKNIINNLFEINHIKINPDFNNINIIKIFTKALSELGINIKNPLNLNNIKEKIRFYIKENRQVIFLANTARPKLVYKNNI